MRPGTFGALVDGGIPVIAGVYVTLLGFRVLGKRPGVSDKYDGWHDRSGPKLKVLGPLIVAFGLFQMAVGLARRP